MVARVGPIICQGTHRAGEAFVVGGHSAGIAQRADILGRVKTERGGISQGAGSISSFRRGIFGSSADGLGIVFYNQQSVMCGKIGHLTVVGRAAVEMHCKYSLDLVGQVFFEPRSVDIERTGVGLGENRYETVVRNCQYRSYVSVGRDDNGVARLERAQFYICSENQSEGIETVAHTHSEGCSCRRCKFLLEHLYFGASDVSARADYPECGFLKLLPVCGVYQSKVQKRILHLLSFRNVSKSRT